MRWDLWGLQPGTYELTVAVGDDCGFCGATKKATVVLATCPDCIYDCFCPDISVIGPAEDTNPEDSITFTANVSGGAQESVTYEWTVSAGRITDGQGTPSITVSTTPDMAGTKVTATVKIGSNNPDDFCNGTCVTTASATATIRSN